MSAARKIGEPWKPGQSGNPSGRPKLPEHLRAIASLTQDEVTKLVSKYARMTRDELQAAVSSTTTPMLEISIASIFAQAAKHGDFSRLAFLLDRAIGKVKDVQVADDELAGKTTAELLELVKQKMGGDALKVG